MNTFLTGVIILVVIIAAGILLVYGICSIRKNALKTGVLVGLSGVMMVLLSVFKKDVPKNDRRIELTERTKKDLNEK